VHDPVDPLVAIGEQGDAVHGEDRTAPSGAPPSTGVGEGLR
jgi:hypothetical protein